MKRSLAGFCLFVLISVSTMAQRVIGTWQSHVPYNNSALQVTHSEDRIYCATPYAVYYIENSDGSVNTLTKSTGLNDANPKHIAYNSSKKTLVITYANSNIDLLVNGTDLYNLPDIKNASTGSSKNINDITMIGDYAYLGTDLGISVLDLEKQEIKDNYIIGDTGQSVRVNSIASDGTYLYAATSEGLKSAPLSSSNLQNYANWATYGPANGLPVGECKLTGQLAGKFFAVIKDTLYCSTSSNTFTKIRYDSTFSYQSFTNTEGYLYACIWGNYVGKVLRIKDDGTIQDLNFVFGPRPRQITYAAGTNWLADEWGGLLRYNDTIFREKIYISGPPTSTVFRMATSDDNILYYAAGNTDGAYISNSYDGTGPVKYDHSDWTNYPISLWGEIGNCYDLVDLAVDNVRKKVYYASLQGGLVEWDLTTNHLTKYDTTNSSLGNFFYVYPRIVKTTALCLDPSGNLWISNPGAFDGSRTLAVKTPDNKWASFFLSGDGTFIPRQIVADDYGQIWIGGRGNYMLVYNPGQDVLSASDDQLTTVTTATGSGGIPNANVWTIIKDKSGDIWMGSDQGIATFYCTGSASTSNGCDATLIKVNQGGFIGYLFSTEIVKAIAVDGANRKWVGSTNGVWLISEDGTKQLLHFTEDNSPLPSNNIATITVDQKSGEVYIGTELGLVSYQGDAILGDKEKGKAFVYPNPVRPDYSGPIAIKGLVDEAYVKITDAAGILVYQGKANGGEMIWDGKGYNGKKVETGVYLVYAATDMGKEHNVGKIIFIN